MYTQWPYNRELNIEENSQNNTPTVYWTIVHRVIHITKIGQKIGTFVTENTSSDYTENHLFILTQLL